MKKVAFICVHNSCRSQIAEAFLGKHLASDVLKAIQQEVKLKSNKSRCCSFNEKSCME